MESEKDVFDEIYRPYLSKVSSPSLSNTKPPVVEPVVACTLTVYLQGRKESVSGLRDTRRLDKKLTFQGRDRQGTQAHSSPIHRQTANLDPRLVHHMNKHSQIGRIAIKIKIPPPPVSPRSARASSSGKTVSQSILITNSSPRTISLPPFATLYRRNISLNIHPWCEFCARGRHTMMR